MNPRYTILAAAVNTCLLSEAPLGEVLLEDDGSETTLRPRFEVTEVRPALRELVTSGFVRVYVEDEPKRVLSTSEALEVIERDEWPGGTPFYTLITTPAGDADFEREWETAGRPARFSQNGGWAGRSSPDTKASTPLRRHSRTLAHGTPKLRSCLTTW